jgi:hypothetical protein
MPMDRGLVLDYIELSGAVAGDLMAERNEMTKQAAVAATARAEAIEKLASLGVIDNTPEGRAYADRMFQTPEGVYTALVSLGSNMQTFRKQAELQQKSAAARTAIEPGEAVGGTPVPAETAMSQSARAAELIKQAEAGRPPFLGGRRSTEMTAGEALLGQKYGVFNGS